MTNVKILLKFTHKLTNYPNNELWPIFSNLENVGSGFLCIITFVRCGQVASLLILLVVVHVFALLWVQILLVVVQVFVLLVLLMALLRVILLLVVQNSQELRSSIISISISVRTRKGSTFHSRQ